MIPSKHARSLYFTPRTPWGRLPQNRPGQSQNYLRASETAPANSGKKLDPASPAMQGIGGQTAENQFGGSQGSTAQMAPDHPGINPGVKAPAALAPTVEGSAPKLYTPPDNRTLPSKDDLKKFFPQHEGVWGEISDGQPSGALGFSSKGWEYGAGNPIPEEPEKEDPLKNAREKRTMGGEWLKQNNWFNQTPNYNGKIKTKPKPGDWDKPVN